MNNIITQNQKNIKRYLPHKLETSGVKIDFGHESVEML